MLLRAMTTPRARFLRASSESFAQGKRIAQPQGYAQGAFPQGTPRAFCSTARFPRAFSESFAQAKRIAQGNAQGVP